MLTLELHEHIRSTYYIDHKSIRQLAEKIGYSHDTMSCVISEDPLDALHVLQSEVTNDNGIDFHHTTHIRPNQDVREPFRRLH